ncbi:MAG: radical SAM protein [Tannerellaceae bacterium]|nr:radical SAM protein [Tannerellaceae bacterium]
MILTQYNIFSIPVGDYFDRENKDFFLVYAPLSGNMFLADHNNILRLEQGLQNENKEEDIEELLEMLLDESETPVKSIREPEDYRVLYILPNYICNFSCSYCYSAKGRSTKQLLPEHLKATLDYFIDAQRCKGEDLRISFVGGGEPMLSWELVKYALEYATHLATQQNIRIHFGLITNGSVINSEMINTLADYRVKPRISFEILEEVQNKQRGQYQKVCNTLGLLSAAGIYYEVRSIITPGNVDKQEEMVREMVHRFPQVDTYYFDPVTDPNIFSETEFTRNFYTMYNQSFIQAKRLATQHGKEVRNAVSRSLDEVVERFCNGELCLTPEGTFSNCLEISSPQEPEYQQHLLGGVNNKGQLTIEREKFHLLKNRLGLYTNPTCTKCFLKWNCGGGCMANNRQYKENILDIICCSNRALATELLLERLNENYLESNGVTLKEIVQNYNQEL